MDTKTIHKRAIIFMRARETTAFGLRDRLVERAMIEHQRAECGEVAQRLNAVVVREYEEHGGAGRLDKRSQPKLMLDELQALQDVDYVITTSLDRLTRSYTDFNQIQFELEIAGAKLVTAAGDAANYQKKGGSR